MSRRESLHINNVAVRDQYRRRGIGRRAYWADRGNRPNNSTSESHSSKFAAGNHAAQALYEKNGFKPIARRADYYTDPREDAVVMSLTLWANGKATDHES